MDHVEWLTDPARLAAIAPEWDAMAALDDMPFALSAWLVPWLEAFAPREGARVALLRRGAAVAAGAALWDSSGVRRGAVMHGLPPYFRIAARDEAARARLAAAVVAASPGVLEGRSLVPGEATFASLLEAARLAGRWTLLDEQPAALVTETSGSWEDFLASLSSKTRSELGRLRRKAAREHELAIDALGVPEDVDAAMERFLALEASGWKGSSGGAILCDPQKERFFRGAARALHAAGLLRLSELRLDGELAAGAFTILHRRRAFTLRVAFDERHRTLGPGFVLLAAMLERCFGLELEAYEFCGAAEDYERRFGAIERPRARIRIYRRRLAPASRYLVHRRVRPLWRSLRRRSA